MAAVLALSTNCTVAQAQSADSQYSQLGKTAQKAIQEQTQGAEEGKMADLWFFTYTRSGFALSLRQTRQRRGGCA